MAEINTDLSRFTVGNYKPGSKMKMICWYFTNQLFFFNNFPWPYSLKVALLRLYGCRIGKGAVIKPNVRIKYPWKLRIGINCWIGEDVWIDNLADISIGDNVCLSQGALLLTGNHDYTKIDFPYRLGAIALEDGVWIGAKSTVCPGVVCRSHSILTVNSVAARSLEARKIYSGNPAIFIRERVMTA
jgi:putative colanic acid biosynthesis acetyltransferase WcaF